MKYVSCIWVVAVSSAALVAGCAAPTGYEKAFSQTTALNGNSRAFAASTDQIFRTAKITLVQQGFTIEQADSAAGLLRGGRILQDPKDAKLAYLITTTVDISGAPSGEGTVLTLAASQQTVLHKDSNKYYKLLGIVPIPTGKEYQTVVRKEGNIGTVQFYKDFFDAVDKNLKQARVVASPLPEIRVATAPAVSVIGVSAATALAAPETPAAHSGDEPSRPDAQLSADHRTATHDATPAVTSSAAIAANASPTTPEQAKPEPATPPLPSIQTMPNPFSQPPATSERKPE